MNLSKNAVGNLINRYKAVLKKCHLLNTFGSLAIAGVLATGSLGMGAGFAHAATELDLEPASITLGNETKNINALFNDQTTATVSTVYQGQLIIYGTGTKEPGALSTNANITVSGVAANYGDLQLGQGRSVSLTFDGDITLNEYSTLKLFNKGNITFDGNITLAANTSLTVTDADVVMNSGAITFVDDIISSIVVDGPDNSGSITLGDGSANLIFNENSLINLSQYKELTINGGLEIDAAEFMNDTGAGDFAVRGYADVNINGDLILTGGGDMTVHSSANISVYGFDASTEAVNFTAGTLNFVADPDAQAAQTFIGDLALASADASLDVLGGTWGTADAEGASLTVNGGNLDVGNKYDLTSAQLNVQSFTYTDGTVSVYGADSFIAATQFSFEKAFTLKRGAMALVGNGSDSTAPQIFANTGTFTLGSAENPANLTVNGGYWKTSGEFTVTSRGTLTVADGATFDVSDVANGLVATDGSVVVNGSVAIAHETLGDFSASSAQFTVDANKIASDVLSGDGTLTVTGLGDVFVASGGNELTEIGYIALVNEVKKDLNFINGAVILTGVTYDVESLNGVNASYENSFNTLMAGTLSYADELTRIKGITENTQNIDGAANYSNSTITNGAHLTLTGGSSNNFNLSVGDVNVKNGASLTLGQLFNGSPYDYGFGGDITVDGDTSSLNVEANNITIDTGKSISLENGADLTVDNGGMLTVGALTISETTPNTETLINIIKSGALTVGGNLTLTAMDVVNVTDGSMTVAGITMDESQVNIGSSGTLNINGNFGSAAVNISAAPGENKISIASDGKLVITGNLTLHANSGEELNFGGGIRARGVGFGFDGITFKGGTINLVGDNNVGTDETFTGKVSVDGGNLSFAPTVAAETWDNTAAPTTTTLTLASGAVSIGANATVNVASFVKSGGTLTMANNTSTLASKAFDFGTVAQSLTLGTFTLVGDTGTQTFKGDINLNSSATLQTSGAGTWGDLTDPDSLANITLNSGTISIGDSSNNVTMNLNSLTINGGTFSLDGDNASTINTKVYSTDSATLTMGNNVNNIKAGSFNFGHANGHTLTLGTYTLEGNGTSSADNPQTFTGSLTLDGSAADEAILNIAGGIWNAEGSTTGNLGVSFGSVKGSGTLNLGTLTISDDNADFSGLTSTAQINAKTLTTTTALSGLNFGGGTVTAKALILGGALTLAGGNLNLDLGKTLAIATHAVSVTNGKLTVMDGTILDVTTAGALKSTASGVIDNNGIINIAAADFGDIDLNGGTLAAVNTNFADDALDNIDGILNLTGFVVGSNITEAGLFNLKEDFELNFGIGGDINLVDVIVNASTLNGVNSAWNKPTVSLMAGVLDYADPSGAATVISHIETDTSKLYAQTDITDSSVKNGASLTLTGDGGSTVLSPGSVAVSEGGKLTLGAINTPASSIYYINGDITVDGAETAGKTASLVVDGMDVTLEANPIANATGALALKNNGDLTIVNGGALTVNVLDVELAGANTSTQVNIGSDTSSGSLTVKNSGYVTSAAKFGDSARDNRIAIYDNSSLNLGGDLIFLDAGTPTLSIAGTIQAHGFEFGTNSVVFDFDKGTVRLVGDNDSATTDTFSGGSITVNTGATLAFSSAPVGGNEETWGDITTTTTVLTLDGGRISLDADSTVNVASFVNTAGTLHMSNATSVLAAKAFDFGTTAQTLDAGTFTLVAGTGTQAFKGNITLDGALFDVQGGTWGTTDANGAHLTLNDDYVTMAADSKLNLKSFTNAAGAVNTIDMGSKTGTIAAASFDFGTKGFTFTQGTLELADDKDADSIQNFTGNFTLQGYTDGVTLNTGSGVWGNDSANLTLTSGTISGAGQLHVDTLSVGNGTAFSNFTGELNAKILSTTGNLSAIDLDNGAISTKAVALSASEIMLQGGTLNLVDNGSNGATVQTVSGALTLNGAGVELNIQGGAWTAQSAITVTEGNLTIAGGAGLDVSDVILTATSGTINNVGTLNVDQANLGTFDFTTGDFTLGNSIGASNLTNSGMLSITGFNAHGSIEEEDYLKIIADLRVDLGNINGEIILDGIRFTAQSLTGVNELFHKPTKTLMAGTLNYVDPVTLTSTTTIAAITENTQTATTVYDSTVTGSGVNLVLTGLGTSATGSPQTLLSPGNVDVLAGASLTLGDATTSGESLNFGGNITIDGTDANGVASSLTVTDDTVTMANSTGTNFDVTLRNGANFTVHNDATVIIDSLLNDNKGIITIGNSASDSSTVIINNALTIADVDAIVGGATVATAGQIYLSKNSSLQVNDTLTFTAGGNLMADGGKLLAQGFSFGEATTLKGGSLTFMLDPNVAAESAQTFSGELTAEAGNITFSSGGIWGDLSADLSVDGTSKTQLGVGTRVNLAKLAISNGTLEMGTNSTISAASFDLGADTFTLTNNSFELVSNGFLSQGFNGSLTLDGAKALLDVQSGTWGIGIGTGASAASLTLTNGTLNVADGAVFDASYATFTFGKDSNINLEANATLNVDIAVFGSVDLEKGNDIFTMNTDLGTLTAAAGSILNLTDNPDPYVSVEYFDVLKADIQARFDALTDFEGTVSIENAFQGFSDSLSGIDTDVDAPTFTIGAGHYGSATGFNSNESTFSGIHADTSGDTTDSTVSDGILNLTGNGIYNTDRVFSEGSVTVNSGELNLGFDGTAATDGGVVKGNLTVNGTNSDIFVYGMKDDASMGVTVTGTTTVSEGGHLEMKADGKFNAQNVVVGNSSSAGTFARFYVNGDTTLTTLTIKGHGTTVLGTETFNADSVTVNADGIFAAAESNIAYDASQGLGVDALTVADGGNVYVGIDKTLSVNSASFAGDTVNFRDINYGGGGALSANSVELTSTAATGTTITNASIITSKFDAAGDLTFGAAETLDTTTGNVITNAGNLTITSNGTSGDTKLAEWTASEGEDVTIANGTLSLGLGAVVDLSDVTFTAGNEATLESVKGSNLMVGLGTVGLTDQGLASGTATVKDADVSGLLGTVTIEGFDNLEINFDDDGNLAAESQWYTNMDTAGKTAFGNANIIYEGVSFGNTEKLTINTIIDKGYSGLGNSQVSIDVGGSTVGANESVHVGQVLGTGKITVDADGELSISGLVEGGSEDLVLFEGTIDGSGNVEFGNASFGTVLKGKIDKNGGDITANNVNVTEGITLGTSATPATGNVALNNVTTTGIELNTSGTAEFENVTANNIALNADGGTTLAGAIDTDSFTVGNNQLVTQLAGSSVNVDGIFTLEGSGSRYHVGTDGDLVKSTFFAKKASLQGGVFMIDPSTFNGIENAGKSAFGEFVGGEIDGILPVLQNSFLVLGDDSSVWAEQTFKESALTWDDPSVVDGAVNAALFIRKAQVLSDTLGGLLIDGAQTSSNVTLPSVNTATFAANSLLVVDAGVNGVGMNAGTAALTATGGTLSVANADNSYSNDAKLHIVDGTNGTLTVVSGFVDTAGNALKADTIWDEEAITVSSKVLKVEGINYNTTTDAVEVELSVNVVDNAGYTEFQGETVDYLNSMLQDGIGLNTNSTDVGRAFLSRALTEEEGYAMGTLNSKRTVATIEGASQMAAVGGVSKGAMESSLAAGGAIFARNSLVDLTANEGANAGSVTLGDGKVTAEIGEHGISGGSMADKAGIGLWLTPLYSWNMGSGFNGGALEHDYDMGLGGIALGADFTNKISADSAFRLGLAFNVGTGYSDSTGDYNSTSNDFNFWGLSLYGAFQKENFVGTLDFGFTSTYSDLNQDLPQTMGMGNLQADVDAFVFTAGLNLEYTFKTEMMHITPHAGVRYMSATTYGYDIDSSVGRVASVNEDTQSVWYFPVGVTLAADIESASGWKFTPKLDLGFIAAAGDLGATSSTKFTGVPGSLELSLDNVDDFMFNGGLGFELSNPADNMSIGLNYNIKAGDNETGHLIFANFRYDF